MCTRCSKNRRKRKTSMSEEQEVEEILTKEKAMADSVCKYWGGGGGYHICADLFLMEAKWIKVFKK